MNRKLVGLFKGTGLDPRVIKYDTVSLFSVTSSTVADKISDDIAEIMNRTDLRVLDATACIGGNTISFAKKFDFVLAVEIDTTRSNFLKENINSTGIKNVEVLNKDFLDVSCEGYNVLFIDPPWGGVDYKKHQEIELFLSNIPVTSLVIERIQSVDLIAVKVPLNYKFDLSVLKSQKSIKSVIIKTYKKMHIIYILSQRF